MNMNQQMMTLQSLLNQSEWNSSEKNKIKQFQLINQVIHHAYNTVPFYKTHYASLSFHEPFNSKTIHSLPVLTRKNLQCAGNDLLSLQIPALHGDCYPIETSGSTGQSVRVFGTDFTRLFYDALMLREHTWRQRDFKKTLMSIRWANSGFAQAPEGHYQSTWGPPINQYQESGPSVLINITSNTNLQIDAIKHYKPNYLQIYPSQIAVLARYCIDNAVHLPSVQEIRTTGESLTMEQIRLVKTVWPQILLSDIYSCCEIGNIAQQCMEYNHYHVNSEHVYLEIVDDNNNACSVGQTGRVLVTSLMNYATPLIRYELGDYAAFGEPCPCGRGLPVIQHILGRTRNRLIMPNGESRFPYLGDRSDFKKIADIAIGKFQFIQHTVYDIEIKVVVYKPVTLEQELQFIKLYQTIFDYPFNITITYLDDIPTGHQGKFEEFISMVESN